MEIGILKVPIAAGDVRDLNRILHQLSPSAPERSREKLEAAIAIPGASPGSRVFVARDDRGAIVGTASLFIVETLQRRMGHVEDVVVDEASRGRGIGEALMAELIAWAKIQQLSRLDLTSNPKRTAAHVLYLKFGFETRETTCYRRKLA